MIFVFVISLIYIFQKFKKMKTNILLELISFPIEIYHLFI